MSNLRKNEMNKPEQSGSMDNNSSLESKSNDENVSRQKKSTKFKCEICGHGFIARGTLEPYCT